MSFLERQFEANILTTNLDAVVNWSRKSASVADDVRPRLLRHRNDCDGGVAV